MKKSGKERGFGLCNSLSEKKLVLMTFEDILQRARLDKYRIERCVEEQENVDNEYEARLEDIEGDGVHEELLEKFVYQPRLHNLRNAERGIGLLESIDDFLEKQSKELQKFKQGLDVHNLEDRAYRAGKEYEKILQEREIYLQALDEYNKAMDELAEDEW